MSTEAERLKRRLEELEKALTQLKTEKDEETQQLRNEAEEARANLELEQKRSASLEKELRSVAGRTRQAPSSGRTPSGAPESS